ncbi:MAG: hypothetical protein AAGD13_05675 [Pseudomonadota bacterium]
MDKTLFLCGFALVMGVWNVWAFRSKGGPWFWIGIATLVFAVGLFVIDKFIVKVVP